MKPGLGGTRLPLSIMFSKISQHFSNATLSYGEGQLSLLPFKQIKLEFYLQFIVNKTL